MEQGDDQIWVVLRAGVCALVFEGNAGQGGPVVGLRWAGCEGKCV